MALREASVQLAPGPWTREPWLEAANRLYTELGVPDANRFTGHTYRRTALTLHSKSDVPREFS